MDADRSRDPLNDLDVDRELQSLLAVNPSPEFVARVRTRLASEPEPSSFAGLQLPTARWWRSWMFAAAPILAAAVIFIAVLISRPRPVEQVPMLTATALPNTTTTMAALKGRPYIRTEQARSLETRDVARTVTTIDVGRPFGDRRDDVLLDARETAALRALIRGVRRGTVDLAPVLRASTPSAMELPPVADIEIAPITIAPIAEEGVRQ